MVSHDKEHPLFAGNPARYNQDKRWRADIPMASGEKKAVYWRERPTLGLTIKGRKGPRSDA